MKTASFFLVVLLLFLAACSSSREQKMGSLTELERRKLDPPLQLLVAGRSVGEGDYDITRRPDGTREYGVIIRCTDAEQLRNAGIQVGSVFGEIVTARLTLPELKKVCTLPFVSNIQNSSKIYPHN